MKKTLLAAALLAGFAGAAQAQSNVTLYGIIDGGFDYVKADGAKKTGIDSGLQGQSRWGIRGTEDMGNGLKALFVLENGFNVDDGTMIANNGIFTRYAYVGLESAAAGRLTLGRTTNLGFSWGAGIANPFGLSFSSATVGTTFAYNDGALGAGRSNNSVYYYSPVFAGFQGGVGYSFAVAGQEVAGSGNNNRMVDVGLKYDNGPIKAVATYQSVNLAGGAPNVKVLTLGANYNFGIATVFAGYSRAKDLIGNAGFGQLGTTSASFANTGFTGDDNAWSLGASAPVGPGKLYAAYQKSTKQEIDQWAVGYTYDLSKRTNLYAFYADTDAHNFNQNRDISGRQFALGLQHRF